MLDANPAVALDELLSARVDYPEPFLRAQLDDLIEHRDDGVQLGDLFPGRAA